VGATEALELVPGLTAAIEDLAERHHAHFEDAVLHFAQASIEVSVQAHQLCGKLRQAVVAHPLGGPADRVAHDRELAHDVHQEIELADVDAHRLRDRPE